MDQPQTQPEGSSPPAQNQEAPEPSSTDVQALVKRATQIDLFNLYLLDVVRWGEFRRTRLGLLGGIGATLLHNCYSTHALVFSCDSAVGAIIQKRNAHELMISARGAPDLAEIKQSFYTSIRLFFNFLNEVMQAHPYTPMLTLNELRAITGVRDLQVSTEAPISALYGSARTLKTSTRQEASSPHPGYFVLDDYLIHFFWENGEGFNAECSIYQTPIVCAVFLMKQAVNLTTWVVGEMNAQIEPVANWWTDNAFIGKFAALTYRVLTCQPCMVNPFSAVTAFLNRPVMEKISLLRSHLVGRCTAPIVTSLATETQKMLQQNGKEVNLILSLVIPSLPELDDFIETLIASGNEGCFPEATTLVYYSEGKLIVRGPSASCAVSASLSSGEMAVNWVGPMFKNGVVDTKYLLPSPLAEALHYLHSRKRQLSVVDFDALGLALMHLNSEQLTQHFVRLFQSTGTAFDDTTGLQQVHSLEEASISGDSTLGVHECHMIVAINTKLVDAADKLRLAETRKLQEDTAQQKEKLAQWERLRDSKLELKRAREERNAKVAEENAALEQAKKEKAEKIKLRKEQKEKEQREREQKLKEQQEKEQEGKVLTLAKQTDSESAVKSAIEEGLAVANTLATKGSAGLFVHMFRRATTACTALGWNRVAYLACCEAMRRLPGQTGTLYPTGLRAAKQADQAQLVSGTGEPTEEQLLNADVTPENPQLMPFVESFASSTQGEQDSAMAEEPERVPFESLGLTKDEFDTELNQLSDLFGDTDGEPRQPLQQTPTVAAEIAGFRHIKEYLEVLCRHMPHIFKKAPSTIQALVTEGFATQLLEAAWQTWDTDLELLRTLLETIRKELGNRTTFAKALWDDTFKFFAERVPTLGNEQLGKLLNLLRSEQFQQRNNRAENPKPSKVQKTGKDSSRTKFSNSHRATYCITLIAVVEWFRRLPNRPLESLDVIRKSYTFTESEQQPPRFLPMFQWAIVLYMDKILEVSPEKDGKEATEFVLTRLAAGKDDPAIWAHVIDTINKSTGLVLTIISLTAIAEGGSLHAEAAQLAFRRLEASCDTMDHSTVKTLSRIVLINSLYSPSTSMIEQTITNIIDVFAEGLKRAVKAFCESLGQEGDKKENSRELTQGIQRHLSILDAVRTMPTPERTAQEKREVFRKLGVYLEFLVSTVPGTALLSVGNGLLEQLRHRMEDMSLDKTKLQADLTTLLRWAKGFAEGKDECESIWRGFPNLAMVTDPEVKACWEEAVAVV